MASVSVIGNGSVVAGNVGRGGLDVLFGGVEVFEVKAREVGWRKAFAPVCLLGVALLSALAWTRVSRAEVVQTELRDAIVVSGIAAIWAIRAVRNVGVAWRFDHKRKTITRRHWLRGMSQTWNARQVASVKIFNVITRLGARLTHLDLVDASGNVVAEIGRWEQALIDQPRTEHVVGEIKKVMWWK